MFSKCLTPCVTILLFFVSLGGLHSLLAEVDETIFFQTHSAAEMEPTSSTPTMRAIIPPGRPEWLNPTVKPQIEEGWLLVTAGPFPTMRECEEQLPQEVQTAANSWINDYLHSPMAASLLNYSGEELTKKLVHSELQYKETVTVSLGPMQQLHAKLLFSDEFRQELQAKWNQIRQWSRLGQVGICSLVVLALLGTMSGYFRWNHATRGTQSTNLQLASAAAILVIVVVGVTLARWVVWL